MSGRDDKQHFLGRWSRLKTGSTMQRQDIAAPSAEQAPAQSADDDGDPDVVASLPDIETLDKESDYTVFLQEGVPERLRTLALRKLWQSDPVLANLDGLNDYEDDFGAILHEGAKYIRKLVEAGERLRRPGADEPTAAPDKPPGDLSKDVAVVTDPGTEDTPKRADDDQPPDVP